jgi:hypothetical protein
MVKKPRGGAVSLRQIAAGLNERSIATPRRGEWSGVEVQHVLSSQCEFDSSNQQMRLCPSTVHHEIRAKQAANDAGSSLHE